MLIFPPPPDVLGPDLQIKIIGNFCKDQDPLYLEEAGCVVCEQLVLQKNLVCLKTVENLLHVLEEPGVVF